MLLNIVLRLFIKAQLFAEDKEAASGIEYAIVAAMVAAVIGIFMDPISTKVKSIFTAIQTGIGT
ncbi:MULTISPECIES: Flp family type IVb pilin [Pseudomonas]|uniref:Flp family type IVb pilin n=1 Tax=Pseudomonas gingeri TaxID=117681 RepID=A0A7Y7WSM3_9PSED|nr:MULTISPECIES: Flp family type IVb pilin [Pseudomonas]NWB86530.1 Flp family type IVb pilin [Pseudomonas gingeri]RBH53316.1 Flp family type IVb pilin [Pseudomonas sp. MWU13-2860]